jgi:drug/metabolite transporter (DMT)-like permease
MTSPATRPASPALAGLAYTLASAVLLSGLGVATQLAFDAGASVGTLLSGRFLVAAAILWPLVWLIRPMRPVRRQVAAGLLLGVGYSAHAWLFSASLTRLDAGLVDLLLFTYPALVMVGAVTMRRERWSARGASALGAATAGTTLVLAGGLNTIDPLGVALALGSAVAYAAYILLSAGQLERTDPFLLTALVTTGAALTLTAAGIARSDVSLDVDGSVFASIGLVGLVAVAGMSTFVAGIGRLGASRASIVPPWRAPSEMWRWHGWSRARRRWRPPDDARAPDRLAGRIRGPARRQRLRSPRGRVAAVRVQHPRLQDQGGRTAARKLRN